MEKTTQSIELTLKKFTKNASREEKRLLAMQLIYNISLECTDDIATSIGLLDIIKTEMLNDYHKERVGSGYSNN